MKSILKFAFFTLQAELQLLFNLTHDSEHEYDFVIIMIYLVFKVIKWTVASIFVYFRGIHSKQDYIYH
jgi:hypothetical protein